jgi:phospholipid/cholesterol/gamma-HCH transport system permease protein
VKKIAPFKKMTINAIIVKKQVIRLGEKTYKKTQEANVFFSGIGDFFLFLWQTVKETFSLNFEFNEGIGTD